MTIKAHLKTELKRRTTQAAIRNATPAAVEPTPTPAPAENASAPEETPAPAAPQAEEKSSNTASEATIEAATNEGVVAASIEQQDAGQGETLHADVGDPISSVRLRSVC